MNRTDIINAVAARVGATRYLEIGVRNRKDNFDKIEVDYKEGVDPNIEHVWDDDLRLMSFWSDDYFQEMSPFYPDFDVIFIDGDHSFNQSLRDCINSYLHLREDGALILHYCLPIRGESTDPVKPKDGRPWCGEVWRTERIIRSFMPGLIFDCDHGVGVYFKIPMPGACSGTPYIQTGAKNFRLEYWLGLLLAGGAPK